MLSIAAGITLAALGRALAIGAAPPAPASDVTPVSDGVAESAGAAPPAASRAPGSGRGGRPVLFRAMPNTPALVGRGRLRHAAGAHAGADDLAWAEGILGGGRHRGDGSTRACSTP